MIDEDLHMSLQQYRDRMEFPMENLAVAIWGYKGQDKAPIEDHEIVEAAARKIGTLKKLLLASGFNSKMLEAIMEE